MSLSPRSRFRRPKSPNQAIAIATEPLCATCSTIPLEIFNRQRLVVDGYGDVLEKDCCYQHYGHALEVSRQSLPIATDEPPARPIRLPTETGITLHSFGFSHFIVRDDTRWSLVRFSEANLVNVKVSLLHDHANDHGVFELIKGWVSQCTKHHLSCTIYRLNSVPGYVPARLISVHRGPGQEQLRIRLFEARGRRYADEYITLSHCWGSNPELVPRTTIANLKSRMENIPWDDLTKTFQDAIEITERLGKSCIWIDSLCIVQDDPRELVVHCESMSQIYSNSFCTISATSAIDGTEGCFMPRNKIKMRPCVITPAIPPAIDSDAPAHVSDGAVDRFGVQDIDQHETGQPKVVTVLPTFREWGHSMNGALFSRGWTLQERELSVRILHFTSDRVVWECRECYASEDDPALKEKSQFSDTGLRFRLLDGNPRERKERTYKYKFSKWMDLVEEYSRRKLSIKEDKLRAIAGLADAIKSMQQDDTYLSGVWKRDLATQLLWYAIPTPEHSNSPKRWPPAPVASGIPTWSWAAYEGTVVFKRPVFLRTGTAVSPARVQRATPSCITLTGIAFTVPLAEAECRRGFSQRGVIQKFYMWSPSGLEYRVHVTLDVDPEGPQEHELLCLVIGMVSRPWDVVDLSTDSPTFSLPPLDASINRTLPRGWGTYTLTATGLVLLAENSTTRKCDPAKSPLFATRVGTFEARGNIPEREVCVNIV